MDYNLIHFEEIDSTNSYLKKNYQTLDNFTFVSADFQSGGKGRNDRTWESEPGQNLMLSFLVKDEGMMNQSLIISLVVATEVALLLESYGIKDVSVKWPNDVLVGDEKICGILAEGQLPKYLIVGIGLNVNQKEFPAGLRRPATSMSLELQRDILIDELKNKLIEIIVKSLTKYEESRYLKYYKTHNYLLNKLVRVRFDNQECIGRAAGIDSNFCLMVACRDSVLHIESGEIDIVASKAPLKISSGLIVPIIFVLFFIAGVVFLETFLYITSLVCFGISVLLFIPWFIWFQKYGSKPKKLFLGEHKIEAVIFDMDGTLIDSTGMWHDIDKQFFAKRNMELPEDYAKNIVHLGLAQAAKYTKETYGLKESEQEIMDEWHESSRTLYSNDIQLKEGAKDILEFFRNHRIPMSIATANDDTLYLPCIDRLGIGEYFDNIADVNSVKEGKQSSKIYEYLATKMGTKIENTLVIEDMPTCIKTAFDNGFITVAVYDDASKDYNEEKKKNSHLFVNNLPELIEKLSNK